MALDTFANLKTAVANWLARSDLTSIIPDGITLAEAQFNRAIRNRNMETRATTSTSSEYNALPTDYLELRRLHLQGTPRRLLTLFSGEEANWEGYTESTGKPIGYMLYGNAIQLVPEPDATYTLEIDYYAKIPALSNSNTSNWLLASHPDLYLAGTIMAMEVYIQNDPRLPAMRQMYQELLSDINTFDRKRRWSGSSPYTRAA